MNKEKVTKALTKGVVLPVGVVSDLFKLLDRLNAERKASRLTLSDLIREGVDLVLKKYEK